MTYGLWIYGLKLPVHSHSHLPQILRGRAEKPVYLLIRDDRVQLLPAEHLWGKDCWETIDTIREEQQDPEVQVALIGPAGENLVRFASIENGYYDAWARTGLGAVMGSKNLKAIAVRGTGSVKVARKKEFVESTGAIRKAIQNSPFFGAFSKFGSMLATGPYHEFGALPGRNFQTGVVKDWWETRGRPQVPKLSKRGVGCIACNVACAHWAEVKEGPYAGLKMKDLEVTPVISYGAQCDIGDLGSIVKVTEICQRLGMDLVSSGGVIAFAMELFQRGLLSPTDLGGALPWGDAEAAFSLLHKIALRQGVGDLLAEGAFRAGQQIPGAAPYPITVKGMEMPFFDPRARWSTWTLGFITNVRGGDHLRTRNPVENLKYNENPQPYRTEKFGFDMKMFESLDIPAEQKGEIFTSPAGDVNVAKMAKWSEDLLCLFNSLGICIRPPVLQAVGPTRLAELYTTLTGWDITPEELILAGERIWNLQKLVNIREGETREEHVFPARFYQEPLPEGPAQGRVLDGEQVEQALDEYFAARGWDSVTTAPTPAKLRLLGL
ncbi:MAG TPA: aldehyde ferredoxin oxidoreductase C-terminal domain-containing protein [Bacillota bacterium]|nr:aldehyde ferredoxin oxidoreductase C-terminal domain-containing protein [Bacillota bacterium]